ncbi:MAG: UDP-N-acetylmuramoyl-tripeptide--D-alanyl-D-alanine ligase [Bacteroidia bacterium]|nr:UDP-N-acetylmuramoyl-tripeptide--D-alanyl-D-alanine ligase [Bacteroidia bacterium]
MTLEEIYGKYLECGGTVTTDSRTIKGGEMFIALKGENFDGNAYALKSLEAGASYAVVNNGCDAAGSGDPRVIPVEDTFDTLKQLANLHRHNCLGGKHLPVLGLTGTNGKTTTKELIRAVLSRKYKVTATEGNLNNDIGVPLSLLKIKPDTEMAVIEMGANHPDDIKHLVNVCEPDFGLITTVGKAHLLGFGSFEGVKKAKGQLYDFISENGGEIFVNVDDPNIKEMSEARKGLTIIPYGMEYSGASVVPPTPETPFLTISLGGKKICTHLVGAYNAVNVIAAMCVGSHFEVPVEDCIAAIESFVPSNNRSQMQKTERNTLILDAYNANPSSMAAALDSFSLMDASSRIALLGDMRELGDNSVQEHIKVLERIAASDFKAYLVGDEFAKALAEKGGIANVLGHFATSEDLAAYLNGHPVNGSCVLVKGSRGIQMEKVIPSL